MKLLPFTGGSSPWATSGQIADNMLKEEKSRSEEKSNSEENRQPEEEQSNMLDSEIENQDEPSGYTIEKLEEVNDKMAKASEINAESKAVKQNLEDGEAEREQIM